MNYLVKRLCAAVAASSFIVHASAAQTGSAPAGRDTAVSPALAKRKWPGEQGATWQSIAKLPNWQGGWVGEQGSFAHDVDTVANPNINQYSAPLTPKWEAYRQSNAAANNGHGPVTGTVNNAVKCLPHGMPALMRGPHVFMFLFQPGLVAVLSEQGEYRLIHTDGRSHPEDPDLTWAGDSIGHWEGDTLVVDTIAIKGRAEMFMGMPQASENTHVVERYRLDSKEHKLKVETTVTNPDQFTKPWVFNLAYVSAPNGPVESYCTENNRDTDRGVTNIKLSDQ